MHNSRFVTRELSWGGLEGWGSEWFTSCEVRLAKGDNASRESCDLYPNREHWATLTRFLRLKITFGDINTTVMRCFMSRTQTSLVLFTNVFSHISPMRDRSFKQTQITDAFPPVGVFSKCLFFSTFIYKSISELQKLQMFSIFCMICFFLILWERHPSKLQRLIKL